MRWEMLFAALESQADSLDARELADEVAERTRYEVGATPLLARLTGTIGRTIKVSVPGETMLTGRLAACGPDWLLLVDQAQALVPISVVSSIIGLTARQGPLPGPAYPDLRRTIRALARDRTGVEVTTSGREGDGVPQRLTGTLDRVGADWLELAVHAGWESRRARAVQSTVVIPLTAVRIIRSAVNGPYPLVTRRPVDGRIRAE